MNHPEVTIVYTQISKESSLPQVEYKNTTVNPIENLSIEKETVKEIDKAKKDNDNNCRFYSSWRKRSK